MIFNDILILDAFRDEKDLNKWFKMGFKEIMEALHIEIDYYKSYHALYDSRVDDYDKVLENLKKSTYQVVGSYIFSAYRDYTKNEGLGPFGGAYGHVFFTKCLDILQDKYFELMYAHEESIHNRKALERDSKCGCFYCLKVYNPTEITEWCDKNDTALCANCGIDSVIPESAGYPLTEEFLKSMRDFWFEGSYTDVICKYAEKYHKYLEKPGKGIRKPYKPAEPEKEIPWKNLF